MSNAQKVHPDGLSILASPAYKVPANSYTVLLYDELQALGHTVHELEPKDLLRSHPDILHIHWPEYGLSTRSKVKCLGRLCYKLLTARLIQRRGGSVVWTVHNLRPHERFHPGLEAWFYTQWMKLVDGAIALSATSKAEALEAYPCLRQVPFEVVPHGHHRPALNPEISHENARRTLGFDEKDFVFGMVGNIRPYKQVPETISLFQNLGHPNWRLVIAGNVFEPSLREQIESLAQGDPRVLLRFGVQSERDVQILTMACDVSLSNFSNILNSGSVLYALSCDVPAIAPRMGSLEELESAETSKFVRLFDPPLTAEMLEQLAAGLERGRVPLDHLDWPPLALKTEALYRSALNRPRR